MTEHPNATLHRRGHEAFSKGDMATLTELIAEDTVWHVAGKSQLSGDYQGREAVFGFFAKMNELTGGAVKIVEDHDFLGTDEHSVALFRVEATRGGRTLGARFIEVVHWRNGQIAENWMSSDDQYALDEFWS
ncbi:MAG: nuclear transport factor 2 family protein [Dehalococcoidia bacterium]